MEQSIDDVMDGRYQSWQLIWLVLALLSMGGLGGLAAASHRALRDRSVTLALALAYAVIGALFGGLTYVLNDFFLAPAADLATLLVYSAVMGAGGSTIVAATNWCFSVVLPRLGIRLEVKVTRDNKRS